MTRPLDLLARTAGDALSVGAQALGAVRHAARPLHPEGELRAATLTRMGGTVQSGVAWLDEPGSDDALVRVSRAIGLPANLPDIHGLAIRIDPAGRQGDLLLASTGAGAASRFMLLPARSPAQHALTSLLPYRSAGGPIMLAAAAESDHSYALSWARPFGHWVSFGRLDLGAPLGDDPDVSFDPIVHLLPGLEQYGWVRRLREPAYWKARRRTHRTT